MAALVKLFLRPATCDNGCLRARPVLQWLPQPNCQTSSKRLSTEAKDIVSLVGAAAGFPANGGKTGYSFNLDGTCVYLTMAAIFIAQAFNIQLSWREQVQILGVMLLTSKGAAAV